MPEGKGSMLPCLSMTRKLTQDGGVKTMNFLVPGLQGRLVAPCLVSSVSFKGAPPVEIGVSADRGRHGGFAGIHVLGPRKDFHSFWGFPFNFYQDDVNGGWTMGWKMGVLTRWHGPLEAPKAQIVPVWGTGGWAEYILTLGLANRQSLLCHKHTCAPPPTPSLWWSPATTSPVPFHPSLFCIFYKIIIN